MILKEKLQKDDEEEPIDENVYKSLVGCLMYVASTRPDIMYTGSVLSRFLHCASKNHKVFRKRVMRYLKDTLSFGIKFNKVENFELQGYSNSECARSLDDIRTLLVIVSLLAQGVSSWCLKKQDIVAQSTA
ncbi:uncharacterized protein LOC111007777 [Momordica charantia]|uniref:Uncharacterized protein LOC111007777 n=1 Tax=Momordica charantia TaxID=3673 RepID=A0A6J1C2W8_MOMCH|nr:uncharacterized protein LOC111007777 [Momordica charantia]